jgi:serine/threonine protein kinase/Tol biopolymer transport system component
MPVSAGDKLGPYEILEPLGAGGMGEVYRAHDPRMGRDVAIKIAPERFSERFEREVHAVAALNHPNVCTIHDVGPNYLVMELVEGPTLADRIRQGPIPLEEALEIARQIADALEAAHEKGIVHRDLKPQNVKLKPDGTVKVLDFGLAKLGAAPEPGAARTQDSPTLTMNATQVGAILGTAAYMSPEQARGRTVDRRADIWAFGVVLYEMLSGKDLFAGDTVADVLAAVVVREPDWKSVPALVQPLLRHCLEKDPKRRLRDISDAMLLLDAAPPAETAPPRKWLWLSTAAAVVFLLAFAALALVHFREAPPPVDTVRFQIPLPADVSFTQNSSFALSPDGRTLAFSGFGSDGITRIWIRSMDSLATRPLPGIEIGPGAPFFFSADSRYLAFQAEGKLKKIDISGGLAQTVCDAPGNVFGGTWSRGDVILFGSAQGVMRVPAGGGTVVAVTSPSLKGILHGFPRFLPDGRHFLYLAFRGPGDPAIYTGSLDTRPEKQNSAPLLKTDYGVAYVPASGQLLFVRGQTLLAQSFDPGRLTLSGEPLPVVEQIGQARNLAFSYFSASEHASLVYMGAPNRNRQLTWFDRQGNSAETPAEPAPITEVKISPDGTKAATMQQGQNQIAIWLIDLVHGPSSRFTFDSAVDATPVWSPDGSRLAWLSYRGGSWGIYQKSANGSGNDELLYRFQGEAAPQALTDWSHDGKFLIYALEGSGKTREDIWALPLAPDAAGNRKPFPVVNTPANENGAYLSPDGRWIAYISNESGRQEIYVRGLDLGAGAVGSSPVTGKWMVSNGTLGMARWRADGKELLFLSADGAVMSVDVGAGPAFQAGAPILLFKLPLEFVSLSVNPGLLADVTRDHKRFLISMPPPQGGQAGFTAVLNWQNGLRR